MSSQKTEAVTNRIFTIPNVISFIRLCMVPVYMVLLLNGYDLLATFMFALAAGTDWIDGQLARRTNCVSKLGQLLDPAVDRVLMICGVIGLMLYNMGAGILRAVGDSKRPFYFLVVSAVLNIILDLVFVLSLGMGGALSIVRFRTAIKEPLDLAFLFWSIAAGIVLAAGFIPLAVIGSAIIGRIFERSTLTTPS